MRDATGPVWAWPAFAAAGATASSVGVPNRLREASAARAEDIDEIPLDVPTGRGRDEEVGNGAILGGQEPGTVLTVVVEESLGESQGRPLVAFAKSLCPRHPVGEHRSGPDDVVESSDGVERTLDPLQIVGLLEPLVVLPDRLVEGNGQLDAGPDQ